MPVSEATTGLRQTPGKWAVVNGQVHLTAGNANTPGGISRYCQELYKGLRQHTKVHLCSLRPPPLAGRFTFLEHLPLGVEPDEGRGIYHFTRILGCSLMLWRPVRPAVATVHDLGPLVWTPEWQGTEALDRLVFRLSLHGLRRMERIIAVSQFTARSLTDLLGIPGQRITVVYEGVDRELFRRVPDARMMLEHRFGIPDDPGTFNLLHVGRQAPRKNLNVALQALSLLRAAGVPARLIQAGSSGHPRYRSAFLQEVARQGLGGAVVMVEEVPDGDLPALYSAADVLIMPSYVEGFGLPALEAMACGTPVVCSDAGALPEVVGDAGLLVSPQDAQGWAEAVATVLSDRDVRQGLVVKGLQRCRLFSWDMTVRYTMAVYGGLG